jgi:uncharacterized protein YaiE (UPF0345 family)
LNSLPAQPIESRACEFFIRIEGPRPQFFRRPRPAEKHDEQREPPAGKNVPSLGGGFELAPKIFAAACPSDVEGEFADDIGLLRIKKPPAELVRDFRVSKGRKVRVPIVFASGPGDCGRFEDIFHGFVPGVLTLKAGPKDWAFMAHPTQFENVAALTKANVYFDGKVVSHTLLFADGSKRTLGLIYPGKYHFGTAQAERMAIVAGACSVVLDGSSETSAYSGGEAFEVAANSGFDIEVSDGICEYICSFLD